MRLKNIEILTPMYNLIEYSDGYSKISGSLSQYYRDKPFLDNNNNIINLPLMAIIVFGSDLNSK